MAAIRVHLERLITMEYVRAAAGRNGQRYEYELLFDGGAYALGAADDRAHRCRGALRTACSTW